MFRTRTTLYAWEKKYDKQKHVVYEKTNFNNSKIEMLKDMVNVTEVKSHKIRWVTNLIRMIHKGITNEVIK